MSESADVDRQLSQTMGAVLSVALSLANEAYQQWAERARAAAEESEQRQRELADKLAADRETAAVSWRRVDEPDWIRTRPDEVAEAWASARMWEHLDPRAAETRAKLDFLIDNVYGQQHLLVDVARSGEDHEALARMLSRGVQTAHDQPAAYYETVPADQQRQWLEQQVWGPDSDEQTRIARSSELDDLNRGLPVSVLREMSEETRTAWIALGQQPIEQRREWQRAWLTREVWGPDTSEVVRGQRQAMLDDLEQGRTVPLTAEQWQGWVAQHGVQNTAQPQSETPTQGQGEPTAQTQQRVNTADRQAVRAETDIERQQRAAAAVRETWPEQVAEQVVDRDAFGAFSHRLAQLEERGYSMPESLNMVPANNLIGHDAYGQPVRNPAAFAEWHVKQLVDSLPERGTAADGMQRLEKYLADNAGHPTQSPPQQDVNAQQHATQSRAHPDPARQSPEQTSPRRGAYEHGAEAARLAGEAYPHRLEDSLGQQPAATQKQPSQARQRGPRERDRSRER